jgi:hypothetical protein
MFGKNYDRSLRIAKNIHKMFGFVFGSVVAVVFQSALYLKIYQNNFFNFLKINFDISASN